MAKASKKIEETTVMTKVSETFEEKLARKVQEAQLVADAKNEQALDGMLENVSFVEAQREIHAKELELTKLNLVINQLGNIDPFKTNDGRKFSVNVYPISSFGVGLGQVMGILAGSRSAFVDEIRMQFTALTGLTSIELHEAVDAIGSPAYFKDGQVHDAIDFNYGKLESILPGVFMRLGLTEYKAASITYDKVDLYFRTAEAKALRQLKEHDDLKKLEAKTSDFVLED